MTETFPPNRPLTPKVRRRSWNEPAVRGWWLTAGALMLVVVWIVIEQMNVARHGQYRIEHWTHVPEATIVQIGTSTRNSYHVPPEQLVTTPVKLTYVDAAGETRKLDGILEAQAQPVHPEQKIPILVDPANPERWTDRVKPVPFIEEVMAAVLLLPLIVVFGLVALVRRRKVLQLWQTGLVRQGNVVSIAHSAAAPRSMLVRCAIESDPDKRLLSVAIPRSVARPQPGDPISLITPPRETGLVIAMMLYE